MTIRRRGAATRGAGLVLVVFATACTERGGGDPSDHADTDSHDSDVGDTDISVGDTDVRWDDDPCNTGTPSLTVGHFDGTSVVPYATNQPVETFHGPQGSWHILPDIHAVGVPKAVELRWSVTDPVSGVDLSAAIPGSRVWLIGSDPSHWQCEGGYDDLRLIFDPRVLQVADGDVGWHMVCNRPLTLVLSVWSADGQRVVQHAVDFIPLPYPPDVEIDGPCPRAIGE